MLAAACITGRARHTTRAVTWVRAFLVARSCRGPSVLTFYSVDPYVCVQPVASWRQEKDRCALLRHPLCARGVVLQSLLPSPHIKPSRTAARQSRLPSDRAGTLS